MSQTAKQAQPGRASHGHDGRHNKHAGHSVAMFRDRFWPSLVLTIPTLFWVPMIQEWLGYMAPQFPGCQFMPPVFGAHPVLLWRLGVYRGGAAGAAGQATGNDDADQPRDLPWPAPRYRRTA